MDLGIKGRKALVNGGSAGLGKGSAQALAAEGVDLYISARQEDRLQATAEQIRGDTGASVTIIVADHSSKEGRDKILSICPDPDILVGTCSPAPFTPDFRKVTAADWEEHLAVGLISPIEFIRATVDGMCDRGFGRIVNISTGASKFPSELRTLSGAPRVLLCLTIRLLFPKPLLSTMSLLITCCQGCTTLRRLRSALGQSLGNKAKHTKRLYRTGSMNGKSLPRDLATLRSLALSAQCSAAIKLAILSGRIL